MKNKKESCSGTWELVDAMNITSPLEELAVACLGNSSFNAGLWNFHCQEHDEYFDVFSLCPGDG